MKTSFLKLGLLAVAGCTSACAQQADTPNPNLAGGKKFVSSDPNTRNWDRGLTDGSWVPAKGNTYATNDTDLFPKR
jgi:hypothetical protein